MKALTVQQPWAWAIVHGGKPVENRTQAWQHRGELAIHAGTRWSERGARHPLIIKAYFDALASNGWRTMSSWEALEKRAAEVGIAPFPTGVMGAVVGVADLVDVHPDAGCCRPWGESSYVEHGGRIRRVIQHLVLEDARALAEPVPAVGRLGLWTVPADVEAQIRALA